MPHDQIHLLGTRRFLPLFVTQFLGALNDNLFKNAMVILIAYQLASAEGLDGQLMVTLAAGIFILPFFLFSALAGQLADRFERSRLMRLIKLVEIPVMGFAAWGFLTQDIWLLMTVLFVMGSQSAFFGPLKYAVLPDHLKEDELIAGNAFIETGTFMAILLGTIAGGLLIQTSEGLKVVSTAIVMLALTGWAVSFRIPQAAAPAPDLRINPNILGETFRLMGLAKSNRTVFLSILGISWFWLLGATFLSQFPNLAQTNLGANEEVVTLFLTVFTLGIAIGSMICDKLLKGTVSAQYVPLGALGMSLFTFDLFLVTGASAPAGEALIGAMAFMEQPANWRILGDLLGISICGGLFIVPLYALLQARSDAAARARMIAANNVVNALFTVLGTLAAALLLMMSFTVPQIILVLAAVNLVVAVYVCGLLPDALVKTFLQAVLKLAYRVELRGQENLKNLGDRAVLVVNHVSFLDALLLAVFLPRKPTFAINTQIAGAWWVKPFLTLVDAFPMDPTNPMAIKSLIRAVEEGRQCVIFPEGRITVTGALMKIYEGPGMVADKARAPLVPIRIDGAQYTAFSRLKGKVRRRLFPRITITIQPPQRFEIPAGVTGRSRRQMAGTKLYDVMTRLVFETQDTDMTLFDALLEARRVHGGRRAVVEDIERKPMSYNRLILGSMILGRRLAKLAARGERLGVLLPNSAGAAVTFFALQAFGRVPAMLNFSTGLANMRSACQTAQLGTIVTSRRFVRMAKLEDVVEALGDEARIIYLEDMKKRIGLLDKLYGLVASRMAGVLHARRGIAADDAAVTLFTSGSEGVPKGVVLSHRNLLSNRQQLAASVDFNPTDVVFNALPVFHSFGLTGGMLLPVLSGIRTFLYPSPLHYRIVPALVYDSNATIMFGTDTFLTGYARVAHAYDFYSVRYVFAGAEKVKDETRHVWADKFGLRILEGYGATETSPVLATNTPMHYRAGTVGRLLPGIRHRLEKVPGIEEGGRLVVSGPNIMKGYLLADQPGVLQPPAEGEYDTGDIVDIDGDGFVRIKGRAKRFAKIAGEMVSLGAVEAMADAIWPNHMNAVVSQPDPRKGEQLILLSDNPQADRAALMAHAKAEGATELMVPKTVVIVDSIPVLGTGKTDYVALDELARSELAA